MGGAFVAVADDATAAWWNPAGLASGAYLNLVVEKGVSDQPADPTNALPGLRQRASGFALAFPALGVSYYRLQLSELTPISTTAVPQGARQQQGGLRTLVVGQYGVTVGQSIGTHLVVASTVKMLRGGVATGALDEASDGLDQADDLEVERRGRADLDLGVMARFGKVRLGAALKNATRPHFGEGEDRMVLVRQARAGGAVISTPVAGFESVVVAADVDLTRTPTLFGDVRHAAVGTEVWLRGRRFGARGGLTTNTVGERRPSSSYGVSVAPIKGLFIEASRTTGADETVKGWTSTVRFAF